MADPTQIHQLIMNLCTNSSHAMAEHGGVLQVTLSCWELLSEDFHRYPTLSPGSYICLEVGDTGCGMESDLLERIFEPYFTTKEKDKGTGMGLAVVHGIVVAHRGHINVYSRQGQGTTFRILLPTAKKKNIVQIEKKHSETLLPTGTEHVLMVDDEPLIIAVNKEILSTLGYRVTAETSSTKALELFRSKGDDFDLVITDLTMPDLTGIELTQKIVEIRPEIPVILCTGYSELINAEQAHSSGIRECLYKPVNTQNMAITVRRVLNDSK